MRVLIENVRGATVNNAERKVSGGREKEAPHSTPEEEGRKEVFAQKQGWEPRTRTAAGVQRAAPIKTSMPLMQIP